MIVWYGLRLNTCLTLFLKAAILLHLMLQHVHTGIPKLVMQEQAHLTHRLNATNAPFTCHGACRWYYTKNMRPDEAYVFVEYESRKGRARFTPHTGFQDPTTPSNAPHRESVELRAMVFWEHEQPQAPEMEL